jgi:extracellular elastinolytic metalloproteinase
MGEGWSDVLAFWTEQVSSTIADYTLGQYVSGHPGGIRSRPYSTSSTVNPYTYASLKNMNEVHDIGEVWANTLVNVYAALVKQYGFDANARTDSTGRCGNTVFLHLILDGMALQPCNPTFLNARDAIIQADANRYGGANRCLLWKAFASKGLGITARNQVDNTVVPAGCGNPPKSLNPQRT